MQRLQSFGVERHNIRAAYHMIRDTVEAVTFPRKGTPKQQEDAITAVPFRCVGLSGGMLQLGSSATSNLGIDKVEVVVIGNSKDVESSCTCQVLQRLLQKETQLNTLVVTDATEMAQVVLTSEPLYLVVVLSRGLLEDRGSQLPVQSC